jgi:general secretion pathway protein K
VFRRERLDPPASPERIGLALGPGRLSYRITDEQARLNVNRATPDLLRRLCTELGLEPGARDAIVDSIQDWRDANEEYRLNGAESDYYLSLPAAYRAKDANFESLEELLLVRGVTQELLYGTREKKGLIAYLTLHSPTGGINVNAAPRDILLCIPEMTPELADAILEERKARRLSSADMTAIAGAALKAMEPFISFEETNVYGIEAAGYRDDERRACTVAATVRVEGPGSFRYLRYKSPAERMLP